MKLFADPPAAAASGGALPHRFTPRAPVRLWNRIASRLDRGDRWVLSVDGLLESAAKRAGSADLGDNAFREPLARLVEALSVAPDYHPFGRFLIRNILVELLRNRSDIESAHRRHPGLEDVPLRQPVFIVGLPRSGTTFLFNALCADRRFRYLRGWETSRPATGVSARATGLLFRRLTTRAGLAMQYYLTPELRDIHESGADAPEECTTLLMLGFASQAFVVLGTIPGYLEWLRGHDYLASLQFHKRALQLLSGGTADVRWVLKSPHHLPALDALFRTYPDGRVIYLHRNPFRVIPSCARLVESYRATFCDQVDRAGLGREVLALAAQAVGRAAAARGEHADRAIIDVEYDDLLSDPLGTVSAIYRELGIPLPAPELQLIRRTVESQLRRRPPPHYYTIGGYGLTEEDVRAAFPHSVSMNTRLVQPESRR